MSNVTVSEFKDIVSRVVKHTPVSESYVAIQITTTRTSVEGKKPGVLLSEGVAETICHRDRIPMFEQGASLSQVPNCHVYLLTDSVLKCYRNYGFDSAHEEHAQKASGVTQADLDALESPFTALQNGIQATPVHMDFSSHMLFHPEKGSKEIYPVAIELDYIEANLSNEKYDLEKARQILEAHPDVRLNKDDLGVSIQQIPYYNASSKRSHCLSATFTPTHSVANQLWEVCQKISDEFPSCRFEEAIDVIDALGLIKGGAMRDKYVKRASESLED